MAKNLYPRQKAWNEAKQARMSALSSVLGHIKSLKAMGLTSVIAKYVENCREVEQTKIDRLRWMNAAHNSSGKNAFVTCEDLFTNWHLQPTRLASSRQRLP